MTTADTNNKATTIRVDNLVVDIPLAAGVLHAVRGISFYVEQGETLSIVGESGCGKSLTSLALMNLLPSKAVRTADAIELSGTDLRTMSERQMSDLRGKKMAMIFQEPMTSLNPAYTIGNQLEEAALRHQKISRSEARERAVYLLERVGITAASSRLRQYPHQLSGGLRQRVMIAMALMCGPDLLICDEPTTALDVTIQAQILHLLKDLQREFEMAVILIKYPKDSRSGDSGVPDSQLGTAFPNPIDPPSGCSFHPRCKHAMDVCRHTASGPVTVGDGGMSPGECVALATVLAEAVLLCVMMHKRHVRATELSSHRCMCDPVGVDLRSTIHYL